MRILFSVGIPVLLLNSFDAYAGNDVCPQPSFEIRQIDETNRGFDIVLTLQTFLKYVGAIKGDVSIEDSRKMVFATSDDSERLRNEYFLDYIFCLIVVNSNLEDKEKIDLLYKYREPRIVARNENSERGDFPILVDTPFDDLNGNIIYQGSPFLRQVAVSNLGEFAVEVRSIPGGNCIQRPVISKGNTVIVTGIDIRATLASGVKSGSSSNITFELVGDMGRNDGIVCE